MEIFNYKVIQYGNGMVEVRKYSRPIGAENMESLDRSDEWITHRALRGKIQMRDVCEPEELYNPFTDDIEQVYSVDQLEILKHREERSLKNSFNRTKQEIYRISRQCNWEYFITLTFSSEVVDRYDYDICMRKANKWFNNQKNRYAENLQYMFVPEQHKDGAWHIHGLIAQVGAIKFVDSGKKWGNKCVYNLGGWKNGFSTSVPITQTMEDIQKVSTYITKYITKDLCSVTKGKKRYYRSQNIPKPIVINLLLESGDNDIDMIIDSLGVSLDYEKTVNGYVDVDYKYYV